MSISDRLDQMQARADAATQGPWFTDAGGDTGVYTAPRPTADSADVASAHWREDEVFIAASRSDVPALVSALRAVLDLHQKATARVVVGAAGRDIHHCVGCTQGVELAPWPCATRRAVAAALGEDALDE